jgi:hypothetical protein
MSPVDYILAPPPETGTAQNRELPASKPRTYAAKPRTDRERLRHGSAESAGRTASESHHGFGAVTSSQDFAGSQQQPTHSWTLGARIRGVTGRGSLRPWLAERRDRTGASPRKTALASGSKARVRFPAPGDPAKTLPSLPSQKADVA